MCKKPVPKIPEEMGFHGEKTPSIRHGVKSQVQAAKNNIEEILSREPIRCTSENRLY